MEMLEINSRSDPLDGGEDGDDDPIKATADWKEANTTSEGAMSLRFNIFLSFLHAFDGREE